MEAMSGPYEDPRRLFCICFRRRIQLEILLPTPLLGYMARISTCVSIASSLPWNFIPASLAAFRLTKATRCSYPSCSGRSMLYRSGRLCMHGSCCMISAGSLNKNITTDLGTG